MLLVLFCRLVVAYLHWFPRHVPAERRNVCVDQARLGVRMIVAVVEGEDLGVVAGNVIRDMTGKKSTLANSINTNTSLKILLQNVWENETLTNM